MINLEWFRTFKAIYETGNLSHAAQALFISQPGVSLHLNSLESFTGYRLFERETRKMVPTERGTILYNSILDPMNRLVEAEEIFYRKSRVDKPTISVGLGFETFEYALAEHLAQLPFNLIVRFGETPELLHDLETGVLDLVLTSHKGRQLNLEYTPFTKERIILVCGGQTDTDELEQLISSSEMTAIKDWLKKQIWYATRADMAYLKNFWMANFDCQPEVKPNYIVPNFSGILRCMRSGKGFAMMPDFLCMNDLQSGNIRLAWEGHHCVENTLHFGKRKNTRYAIEIRQLEMLLTKNWVLQTPVQLPN